MKKRIVSGLIGTILLLYFVLAGITVFRVGVSLVSACMVLELLRATKVSKIYMPISALLAAILSLDIVPQSSFLLVLCSFFLISLLIFLFNHKNIPITATALSCFFAVCVGLFMSTITKIRLTENGQYWIWLVFIGAWVCDTFAYFTGSLFGKKKLCPAISPKKTVAGAIGGTLASAIGFLLFGVFATEHLDLVQLVAFFFAGVFAAVLGQIGDLTASVIKRQYGIKDYGKIMPGHGGVMDRFDSFLFVAPAIYFCLTFIL